MPIIDRRKILTDLTTLELISLVHRWDLPAVDESSRALVLDVLVETRSATLGEMLVTFPRIRLKELCRKRGLDDSGREKALLATRLLGVDLTAPTPPKAVPPIRRSRRRVNDQ